MNKFIILVLILTACDTDGSKEEKENFNSKNIFNSIADSLYTSNFRSFSNKLSKFNNELSQSDTVNINEIENYQGLWKLILNDWKVIEIQDLGKIRQSFLYADIYSEASGIKIDAFINSANEINDNFILDLPGSAKGLRAVEYLLFSGSSNETIVKSFNEKKRKKSYLNGIVTALDKTAKQLLIVWSDQQSKLKNIGGSLYKSNKDAIDDHINRMVTYSYNLRNMYIGKPLGLMEGFQKNAKYFEANNSKYSKELFLKSLGSLRRLFYGKTSNSNFISFDDLVRSKSSSLDQVLDVKLSELENIIFKLDKSFDYYFKNDISVLTQIYDKMTLVILTLKVDIVQLLNVTLTFSDNDGD